MLTSQELAAQLEQYDRLRTLGRNEEAQLIGENVLWQLDHAGREVQLRKIVGDIAKGGSTPGARLWLMIGDIFYSRDLTDRARASYAEGLEATPSPTPAVQARLLHGIGNTHYLEGDYITARDCYEASLGISRGLIPEAEAESLLQLSDTARVLGDFDRALSAGLGSLAINLRDARKNAVSRSINSLITLASYLDASGRRSDAERLLRSCCLALEPYGQEYSVESIRRAAADLDLVLPQ